MELIQPDRFAYPLEEPLPSPRQAIKLEIYREKGCEVSYNVPRWIQEEKENNTKFMNFKYSKPIEEFLPQLPRTKIKKEQLSKKYQFEFK